MNFQGTTKDAKRVASSLRRELKALSQPAGELSHTQVLSVLARSLGFKSWESFEAALPEAESATKLAAASSSSTTDRYPLKNTGGRFDFVSAGEGGTPYSCWLQLIQGAEETLTSVYGPNEVKREGDDFTVDGGESEVDWNSQVPVRAASGQRVWVDYDSNRWTGDRVVLLPQNYMDNPATDTRLRLRKELLAEFREYLLPKQLAPDTAKDAITAAEDLLGFGLTQAEHNQLLKEIVPPASHQEREMRAYRVVFNKVFADEGPGHGTDEIVTAVLEHLKVGSAAFQAANEPAEQYLRTFLDEYITLNGPYDVLTVKELQVRLHQLAESQLKKMSA